MARRIVRVQPHRQVEFRIRGKRILVDDGVVLLVELLNKLPGVETLNSCQGGHDKYGFREMGYVQLGGAGAPAILPDVARGIFKQHRLWKRRHRHYCNGCQSMSITLEVHGDAICLRWIAWDYKRLLRMIKELVARPRV